MRKFTALIQPNTQKHPLNSPGPKPTAALVLIALASLIALALLADARSASAQAQLPPIDTPTPTPETDPNIRLLESKTTLGNLNSMLSQIVERVEQGISTANSAAADAPISQGESIAVTFYMRGDAAALADFLRANDGAPLNIGDDYVEAYVPISLLVRASEYPGVARVQAIVPPQPTDDTSILIKGKARVTPPELGNVTSQAVDLHGADAWHDANYTGRGVKVGVIDPSFEGFSELMGNELPDNVIARCYGRLGILPGVSRISSKVADCEPIITSNVTNHGAIVAESLLDIAPDVTLYISNVSQTKGDLKNTVDWMISQGVQVINYSASWPWDGPGDGKSPYSDSPLQTVDEAVNGGIIFVNSAGNNNENTWFGSFIDEDRDGAMTFDENSRDDDPDILEPEELNDITLKFNQPIRVELRWSDSWGGSDIDLNLSLLNRHGTKVASSYDPQSGGSEHIPYEVLVFTPRGSGLPSATYSLVVRHQDGEFPDWTQLRVSHTTKDLQYSTGKGSIGNPAESANPGMLAVGATHYWNTNKIAKYSSRGPAPDGRIKPDITGAACAQVAARQVDTRFIGPNEEQCWFPGTSQASPHVAGLAALVKQRFPDYTPQQIANYLKTNAEPRGTVPNNTWGYGFAKLPAPSTPTPITPAPTHTPIPTGPTFTFNTSPTECSQECQDAYRAVFADIHAFSQDRFGASVDTSNLSITIVPELSPADVCGEFQPWSGIKLSHSQFCIEEYPHYGAFAHEYFHELHTPYILDRIGLAIGAPQWFKEGSAEYFRYRWLDQTDVAPLDPNVTTKSTYGDNRSTAAERVKYRLLPTTLLSSDQEVHALRYILGFLAIDYLIEQTSEGENKVATFFTAATGHWLPGGGPFVFPQRFHEAFEISLDDFYTCFAAHRAAEFPQPGAPCGTSAPAPAPAPAATGRIVFSSNRDGNSEIYAMNADGSNQTRLTNHPGYDGDPVWSPNRQRIAFSSNRAEGGNATEIYVMNADGTSVTRLTNGVGDSSYEPIWSPDGQRIAFSSYKEEGGNNTEIYVMNADGTNVSLITEGDGGDYVNPAWSPDGQRIAFSTDSTDSGAYVDIYVMNVDGSNPTRLTSYGGDDYNANPAWSPDGQRIAFESDRDGNRNIYVMNADGSNLTRLTSHSGADMSPAWSPDGRRIAFQSDRDGNHNIYVMNADGSNPTRLTSHSASDVRPHWTSAAGSGLGPIPSPGDAQSDARVAQLERQVSALQDEASVQQTRIDALNRLLAALQSLIDRLAARVAALESAAPQPPPFVPTPSITPTPTPTPSPTPAATTNIACIENIELDSLIAGTTIAGEWTSDCPTANRTNGSAYYAKFYTFTLDRMEELELQIVSDNKPYLYLLDGAGTDGRVLFYLRGEGSSGDQTQLLLQPASYTLEVTTDQPNVTGDFTLELSLRR